MNVADVMTRQVVSVAPDSTVEAAAKTMLERGMSGLFVVDEKGELAGIVTEGDLLRRHELGTQRNRPWWLRMLVSPGRQAADFTHTHGHKVRDVMSGDVIAVPSSAPLDDAVETMEKHRIKRLAVTENGRMVGVVSRSDILRALIAKARSAPSADSDDRTIRQAIMDDLYKQSWAPIVSLNVTVANGIVDVWGTIVEDRERRAIMVVAENTPGVKQVKDHLVFIEPYSGTVIEGPTA